MKDRTMKAFTPEFYEALSDTIEDVEDTTTVEIVVAACPASGKYREGPLVLAFLLTMIALGVILFYPNAYFPDYAVIPELVLVYVIGFFVFNFFVTIRRLFSSKASKLKNAQDAAKAFFVTAGMMNTQERTGFLFFLSFLEKEAVLLPDKGVVKAIPDAEIEAIKEKFQSVFSASDVSKAILDAVKSTQPIFNHYLPPGEENPDELSNEFMVVK